MIRKTLACVMLCLIVGAAAPSVSRALPTAWYQVGGDQLVTIEPGAWEYSDGMWFMSFAHSTSGYFITGRVDAKEDPDVTYTFIATNYTTAPLAFNFGFTAPLVPSVVNANTVVSSFSGSWTDPTRDGLTIAPTLGDPDSDGTSEIAVAEVYDTMLNPYNMGVDVGTGISFGGGYSGANSGVFGAPYQQGPANGPVGSWANLGVRLGFTLSGNRDMATMNGYASIVPVPEPATLLLLGGGLIGLAGAYRRRRNC